MDSWPTSDVLRDLEGREPEAASLWHEVKADALERADEPDQHRFALAAAAKHATGIRRATLLRRLADAQLLASQPDAALVTLQSVGRVLPAQLVAPTAESTRALDAMRPHAAADDWFSLSADAAAAAVELARAEALSHLIRRDQAMACFADVERRLQRIEGPASAQLWVRWARAQTWFLCEVLGDAAAALEVCARVRARVAQTALNDTSQAIALLRAEEVASTSAGDFVRGRSLVEEQIAMARAQQAPREECLAWNARAILHFGEGELTLAREAYQKALELALKVRWSRREAITSHNLALLAVEQLELDEAARLESHFQGLSQTVGNPAATAEAPLVFASIALARGELTEAEPLIVQARKAAEAGGWVMLVAQARALHGRLHVLRHVAGSDGSELAKARGQLLGALEALETHSIAWSEELDPGEVYALLVASFMRAGQADRAIEALDRAQTRLPKQNVVSWKSLAFGRAVAAGAPCDEALGWFEERGYRRVVTMWRGLVG